MRILLHVFSVCASMKLRIGNVTESVTDNASGNEKEETRNLQLPEARMDTTLMGSKIQSDLFDLPGFVKMPTVDSDKMAMRTVTDNEKERQK